MKKQERITKILEQLDEHYSVQKKCWLDYDNAWQLLFATILSAQCTDARVNLVTKDLYVKYPNIEAFARADLKELEQDIHSTGFYHNKAKNMILAAGALLRDFDGKLPETIEELTGLPGVGRKTANVVLALGFNIPAFPVDTHVERIAKRLGYAKFDDDIILVENKLKKYIDKDKWILSHHLFLLFGRYHCKAINPMCIDCKLKKYCKKR